MGLFDSKDKNNSATAKVGESVPQPNVSDPNIETKEDNISKAHMRERQRAISTEMNGKSVYDID